MIVKGKTETVLVFELIGFREALTSQHINMLGIFDRAVATYFNRQWLQAATYSVAIRSKQAVIKLVKSYISVARIFQQPASAGLVRRYCPERQITLVLRRFELPSGCGKLVA